MTLTHIKNLAAEGENDRVEFKQKLNEPAKFLKEIVAFANLKGGNLLVGVADNGLISGIRDHFEVTAVLEKCIKEQIFPRIHYTEEIIQITSKRSVVFYRIEEGRKKPYYLNPQGSRKGTAYIRYEDQSIQVSRELLRILKEKPKHKDGFTVQLTDLHHEVIRLFKKNKKVTLQYVMDELNIGRRQAGPVLTSLVLTNILHVEPSEKGDIYYP
jgi:predicted HTH transcriptional regulator